MRKNSILFILVIIFCCDKGDSLSIVEDNFNDFKTSYDGTLWMSGGEGDNEGPYYLKFDSDFAFQFGYPASQFFSEYCNIVEEGIFIDSNFIEGEIEFIVEIIKNEKNLFSLKFTNRNFTENTTIITFEYDTDLELIKRTYQCYQNGVPEIYGLIRPRFYKQILNQEYIFNNCTKNKYEGC